MARIPKLPKGLTARISKMERKMVQKKKVETRKKEIMALKKKAETLANQLRK